MDVLQTMDSEAQRRAASAVQGYLGKFIEGTTPGGMKQWSQQNSTTSKDTIGPR